MTTITFYSYKGGVGRTLTLANLGRLLTQLRKRVFVLDLDLEAPGLHYKFGIEPTSGVLDCLSKQSTRRSTLGVRHLSRLGFWLSKSTKLM